LRDVDAGVVTALIGVGGTLLGVVATQWRADVREDKRLAVEEQREEQRLARDTERERDARLFDHRRNAYAAVSEQFHRWAAVAIKIREGERSEPSEEAMDDFWRVISEVDLYGGTEAAEKALTLYQVLRSQVYERRNPNVEDLDYDLDAIEHHNEFLNAARADLGIPPRWAEGSTALRLEIK
jgi:hypothetical protein